MRIRLGPAPSAPLATVTASSGPGLVLPVRVFGGQAAHGTSRQQETLRAIAAATALASPEEALKRVQAAAENPADIIDPNLNKGDLAPIVSAIDAARTTALASAPSAAIVAAARSIGASPRLVQAAYDVVSKDQNALKHGLDWVAAVDVTLLDRAARAGSRAELLTTHVPVQDQPTQLALLEKRVDAIDARLKILEGGSGAPPARAY